MAETIIEKDAVSMYKEDQSKYSVIANRRRAIPAIQDGLKPSHRRLIFQAYRSHFIMPKTTKSQMLLGTTMGLLHPHSSAYDALITMTNEFKTKYPIFFGQGGWGNTLDDKASSERYTEMGLNKFGYDIFVDELAQSNNIVDWNETYLRNGDMEPEFLPAKVPILLINGTYGIGVGMQACIPSHNLGEVIDQTLALIKNPKAQVFLIPDLPQACELIDTNWKEICDTGDGSFKVRGVITTEVDKNDNYLLRIKSLPDMTTTTAIYDKVKEMQEKKQLPMIKDIFNSVDKDGKPDIMIHLRPGSDPEYVKNILYTKTGVMSSVRVNFEVVAPNGIDMKRYSYKDYLLEFINFRLNTKFRLYCNKLQEVMTMHYKVDAFIKILESGKINTIINMIRKYKGTDDNPIIEFMIKECNINDIQAKYILSVNLSRLSAGHLAKYKEDRKEYEKKMKAYQDAVTDDGTIIKNEIIEELKQIKAKYNTPRLCSVISVSEANNIPAGMFKIVITEKNFIRKVPDNDKIGVVRKDNPKFIVRIDNRDNLLIFDNKGKVFKIPVSKIPISDRTSAGTDIRIIIRALNADIAAIYSEDVLNKITKSENKHYLTILTKSNTIKKLDIEDFLNVSNSGLIYSKIRPDDEVVGVAIVPHNLDIAICSGKKALRCSLKDIPLYKRNATGVRAMNCNDEITGLSVFYPNASDIVVITKNGKFNRFNIALLERTNRGKGGSKVIKLDTTDEILNVYGVNPGNKIRVVTSEGVEEILIDNIPEKSSIAPGTRMIQARSVIIRADVIQ